MTESISHPASSFWRDIALSISQRLISIAILAVCIAPVTLFLGMSGRALVAIAQDVRVGAQVWGMVRAAVQDLSQQGFAGSNKVGAAAIFKTFGALQYILAALICGYAALYTCHIRVGIGRLLVRD